MPGTSVAAGVPGTAVRVLLFALSNVFYVISKVFWQLVEEKETADIPGYHLYVQSVMVHFALHRAHATQVPMDATVNAPYVP